MPAPGPFLNFGSPNLQLPLGNTGAQLRIWTTRVYDISKPSQKSNAPQTRMNASALFTTLITQNNSKKCRVGLLHRHTFRQVAWLINIGATRAGGVIRQQLQRYHVQQR